MIPTKTASQEWDQLAERAAKGLVRNIQKHRRNARKKRKIWWWLACLSLCILAGAIYHFRDPVIAVTMPLWEKLESELHQLWNPEAAKNAEPKLREGTESP